MVVPSGADTTTPYAQMKTVIADANAESSVRVTAAASISGETVAQVTDAGRAFGRQRLTLTQEGYRNTIVAELVGGNVYVRGDAAILVAYLGLSKTVANQLKNRWFEIPKGSSYFAEVAQGLTIASGLHGVTMTNSVIAAKSVTLAGVKADVLKGRSLKSAEQPSYKETLYFTTGTKPLPIEVTQVVQGSLGTITFSHWDEKFTLTAPKVTFKLK
jgi:hypothetical protein